MKALIVDDSGVMRRIIAAALAKAGITEVVHAADGYEAGGAVIEQDFDVVLMDWNMPIMHGIDAVREIRSMSNRMPIIMVTTEAEKNRILEAIKAGANNYVIKPFDADMLVTRSEEHTS